MPRRFTVLVPIFLTLGLLLLLAGPAGQVGASTPTMGPSATPAGTNGRFRWTGEQLTANTSITSTTVVNLVTTTICTDSGGNVAGFVSVTSADVGYVLSVLALSASGNYDTWVTRTVAAADSTLVYFVLNPYYEIPSNILDTIVLMSTGYGSGKMVLSDYADPLRTNETINKIYFQGYVSVAGTLTVHSFNVLCYYPPLAKTSTPTPTSTSTPPVRQEITLPSGGSLQLNRTVSYGDVAVVSSVLGLLVVFMLYAFLHRRAD